MAIVHIPDLATDARHLEPDPCEVRSLFEDLLILTTRSGCDG